MASLPIDGGPLVWREAHEANKTTCLRRCHYGDGGNSRLAYPMQGQTPEQENADRAACHNWAVAETGFDPSLVYAAQQAGVPTRTITDVTRRMVVTPGGIGGARGNAGGPSHMLIDVEKRQLRTAPLGGEQRADDIESLAVTDKAILLHGKGIKETDRAWSAVISLETGNVTAGVSTLDSSLSLLGKCTAQP